MRKVVGIFLAAFVTSANSTIIGQCQGGVWECFWIKNSGLLLTLSALLVLIELLRRSLKTQSGKKFWDLIIPDDPKQDAVLSKFFDSATQTFTPALFDFNGHTIEFDGAVICKTASVPDVINSAVRFAWRYKIAAMTVDDVTIRRIN